jgi:hypothetical protein
MANFYEAAKFLQSGIFCDSAMKSSFCWTVSSTIYPVQVFMFNVYSILGISFDSKTSTESKRET